MSKVALKKRAALLKEILIFIESSDAILSADPDRGMLLSLDPKKNERPELTVKNYRFSSVSCRCYSARTA
jgi:hypothetical protein